MFSAVLLTSLTACATKQAVGSQRMGSKPDTAPTTLTTSQDGQVTAATSQTTEAPKPVQMILDSDFGSSTDDLFALMMLHHYIDEGKVDLKGIVVDREGEKNAGLVDIFNTYYGHPDIPVGLERNGVKNPRCFIPYNGICDLTTGDGQPLFSRTFDASKCPEGYKLYRRLLSQAEDNSLVVVAIGFATTLSQLFESGADEYSSLNGADLFGQKVKAVYIQSGRFESGDSLCGYNMRAASRQSAVFYSRLPKNVDLIMSPSNVGDAMDYAPKDVLVDLSYTELNPIKAVYTNYTCDTGQRMWDTNCLVQAVLGDAEYHLSPRGWVTFVDQGEESLMLFRRDPQGNARYQMPGDTYFANEKLMDIRRHTRRVPNPSALTVEAPQPQVIGAEAVAWTKPRLRLLTDKYMGSAGNLLDPDDVRWLFRPVGYTGPNAVDYAEAEALLVDTIYTAMLRKAVRLGHRSLVIVTGPPSSGKTTAVRSLRLKDTGLIYDAVLTGTDQLSAAIARAKAEGIDDVRVVMVYNDPLTCLRNAIQKGKTQWRYTAFDYLVSAIRSERGKLDEITKRFPGLTVIPINCFSNQGPKQVSLADARKWNYDVSAAELHAMLTELREAVVSGSVEASLLPALVGDLAAVPGIAKADQPLVAEILQSVKEQTDAYKMR